MYQGACLRFYMQELVRHGTSYPLLFCVISVTGGGAVVIMAISNMCDISDLMKCPIVFEKGVYFLFHCLHLSPALETQCVVVSVPLHTYKYTN